MWRLFSCLTVEGSDERPSAVRSLVPPRLGARTEKTSHFRISSSGHLWPLLNRKVLEIVLLFLWPCSIVTTKSDPNLSAKTQLPGGGIHPSPCELISVRAPWAPKQASRPAQTQQVKSYQKGLRISSRSSERTSPFPGSALRRRLFPSSSFCGYRQRVEGRSGQAWTIVPAPCKIYEFP